MRPLGLGVRMETGEEMERSSTEKWRLVWPFFLILALHCVAILLFTRGFLLTRTELTSFSQCSDVSHSPCFSSSSFDDLLNGTHPDQRCWTKPATDRLVIIILDALRFDFVAPSTFFDEVQRHAFLSETKPWMDKLQALQKLAFHEGLSARIFKAIADPPTTSLQRLKGLTTGGLPTFIDVGNSFGAPAIVEDNLIHQMARNGKRVLMMGDDTWLQLFPDHFKKSYPYPSFNVKDLHTVDNGCIEHLIPSLYKDDWDVLIAHFLGVDHAGHIFGVDSKQMIEKLEQYNSILEKVIDVLKNQSGPGGLHENTFFLVMGDHGQTINGDHGGGAAEEVETSIFAMSLKKPPASIPAKLDTSSCKSYMDGQMICISSIQQLDFAVTMAALLGIPFPFGSIGRVNPELYALVANTWNQPSANARNCKNWSNLEDWMLNYVNVLCINSWQVKRYIDVYSESSVIGFSSDDLQLIADKYSHAQDNWMHGVKSLLLSANGIPNESCDTSLVIEGKIGAYSNFLASVAELARAKWTEFDLKMMGLGFGILLISLFIHLLAIRRACSLLSNSYILEEGKVASFLLATTGIFNFRYGISKKMLIEATVFLLLIFVLRFMSEHGISKQAISSGFMNIYPLRILWIDEFNPVWMFVPETVPIIALILLAYLLYKSTAGYSCWRGFKHFFTTGTILSYVLIAVHWAFESDLIALHLGFESIRRYIIPRMVYALGFGLLALLVFACMSQQESTSDYRECLVMRTVAMLSTWSPTIILLLGRQGPLLALASIVGGWCIIKLQNLEEDTKDGSVRALVTNPFPVIQWKLLAVCLFFYTGHWCGFDGLRYGAAFIGFEEFILIRQAILLAIDTFGFSHILPIFGLPLIALKYPSSHGYQRKGLFVRLTQMFLIYGFVTAVTATYTVACVAIQRRHLMVWGLFAPKFVFDVVGLLLTDVLICMASLYYYCRG